MWASPDLLAPGCIPRGPWFDSLDFRLTAFDDWEPMTYYPTTNQTALHDDTALWESKKQSGSCNTMAFLWTCPFELVSLCYNMSTSPPVHNNPKLVEDYFQRTPRIYSISVGKNPCQRLLPYPILTVQKYSIISANDQSVNIPDQFCTMQQPVQTNNWYRWPSRHVSVPTRQTKPL